MVPVIALVGRPNVGKSTLFNRLTRTRDALVADFPGLTRDRKYGKAEIAGHELIVIDTGGINGSEEGIETHMADQSLLAIEEADIVLFLVDARAGIMPADHAIAQHLRVLNKSAYLVVNKTDGLEPNSATAEFYALGLGEAYPIAASHGRGVNNLMESVLSSLFAASPELENTGFISTNECEQFDAEEFSDEEETFFDPLAGEDEEAAAVEAAAQADLPIKLAIVGRPNVGKSTLTNRILGEERVIVYDMPGTTRDSIYIPMQREGRDYILIDTAGVRKRSRIADVVEKFSVIKTLQAIEDANVVLLIIDAREGISDQDLSLLGFIINSGRSLVIAVNKWDGLDQEIKTEIKSELDRRLGFVDFARVHFISALHGSGVGNLFESIQEAYGCSTRRISTSLLTRIMQMAQDEHQPPTIRGRRIKLKYAHAGGYNPPIVVIHGNQVKELPDSYKRYLMNYFRRSLQIMGTPIRIQFNEGANPFEGRRNKLTPNQQRKRRRLVQHIKKRS